MLADIKERSLIKKVKRFPIDVAIYYSNQKTNKSKLRKNKLSFPIILRKALILI